MEETLEETIVQQGPHEAVLDRPGPARPDGESGGAAPLCPDIPERGVQSAYSFGGADAEAPCGAEPEPRTERAADSGDRVRQAPADRGRHNIDLGKRGEDAACAFLLRHGYDIIERNWKCAAGEADIIATDAEALHFIEVKTRMSEARGFPAEAVDARKRQRYERIAELFLCSFQDRYDTRITFDVISILVTGESRAFLRLHRNVFANDCF